MSDFERQLHAALREAVPDREVPHRLVPAAARRATTIRRRRTATRGALGVSGIVAGGALLSPATTAPDTHRLDPAASGSPTAGPAAQPTSTVRLVRDATCDPAMTPAGTTPCERLTVEVVRPDGKLLRFTVADRGGSWASAARRASVRVVVEQPDGSRRVAVARPDGEGRWVVDLDVPEFGRLDVTDTNGSLELYFARR